ncbi:MAG: MBL fold metallo-hydrolase [Nitrospira sp.]|nr:MBL fold metallo-hydrolase [Nitrospira sp.]
MPMKYISTKTSMLYEESTTAKRSAILIFGDEVQTSGSSVNGRIKTKFRNMQGFVDEDHLGDKPALELYFIDVGQGDSTFIVTPSRKKILIDGGINNRAFGFLAWKYRFDKDGPPVDIDLLVLSHADEDHIKGLIPIIQHPKVNVRRIIHNGIATFKEGAFKTELGDLDPGNKYLVTMHDTVNDLNGLQLDETFEVWKQAVLDEGMSYNAVSSKTGYIDIGDPDIAIEVLGPCPDIYKNRPALYWLKDASKTINGNSVILRLTYGHVSILFTGDVNTEGSKILLNDPKIKANLSAHIYKAPHHGSHDFYRTFLEVVRPQVSVISSGDEPDHGHPRAVCIGALGQLSRSSKPLVFSTEIAATFVEAKEKEDKKESSSEKGLETLDARTRDANLLGRIYFKRRLHGMINVRTDGQEIYAARRVAAGYWWESYGPITPAP